MLIIDVFWRMSKGMPLKAFLENDELHICPLSKDSKIPACAGMTEWGAGGGMRVIR